MKVLVDLDGVVADLHAKWYAVWNAETGDDLTTDKVVTWDTHRYTNPRDPKHLYEIICRPGFFDDLAPLPGAVSGVLALAEEHRIEFCTATPCADAARAKIDWVGRYFPELGPPQNIVTLTHDKAAVAGDLLIDDSPKNLIAWTETGRPAIGIDWPWNRTTPCWRAKSWAEVLWWAETMKSGRR